MFCDYGASYTQVVMIVCDITKQMLSESEEEGWSFSHLEVLEPGRNVSCQSDR